MMAYAAVLYLQKLLDEFLDKIIYALEKFRYHEKGKATGFLNKADKVVDTLIGYRRLIDVPLSFLNRLKNQLLAAEEISKLDYSTVVDDLGSMNSRLEQFVLELDRDICHPPATLSLEREFANDMLSVCRKFKEDITSVDQAIAAIYQYKRGRGIANFLPQMDYLKNDEVVTRIKIAADQAADYIEDLNVGYKFVWEKDDFTEIKRMLDLLKGFDQLLSHSLEEASSMKDSLLKGVDQLLLQDEASCSRKRFKKEENIVKGVDHLPLPVQTNDKDREILWANQEDFVVGIDDCITKVISDITERSLGLTTVKIVGMGGIGKTTLAKKVFHHPNIVHAFHCLAWVNSVSNVDQLLSDLLNAIRPTDDEIHGQSREDKGESLRKRLKGRKYLIVVDGVWDFEAWEFIQKFFPDDKKGSRILITSRVMPSPTSTSTDIPENPPHCFSMRPLDENQSWELLEKKVFGKKRCPDDLVSVGKKIAERCGGLPLAIVLISGTLLNVPYSSWRSVTCSIPLIVATKPESCLDIIGLSYKYLPHYLKACFLFLGALSGPCEIEVQKLIYLWMAEGFMDAKNAAENCLKELIRRSLVSVGKRSWDGQIKTCLVHDLVRQLCLIEAQKDNFIKVVEDNIDVQGVGDQRHLFFNMDNCADVSTLPQLPHLRSFIWLTSGSGFTPDMVHLQLSGFKWLRVLDMYFLPFDTFPVQILDLVNLRYLALNVTYFLDASISQLKVLETLIVYGPWITREGDRIPTLFFEFWRMPCLSHVNVSVPSCLVAPDSVNQSDLQSLSTITFSSCTGNLLRSMPNLKKLGVSETKEDYENGTGFKSLYGFLGLEILKCSFYKGSKEARSLNSYTLPANLKKLTLSGSCFSWKRMKVLAKLSNLETLKLKNGAFQGPYWLLTHEEVFGRLKQLLIDNTDLRRWETENDEHFPCLERLVLRRCKKLEKIPSGVGIFCVLELIELHHCSESAENSARYFEEQYVNTKVIVHTQGVEFCRKAESAETQGVQLGGKCSSSVNQRSSVGILPWVRNRLKSSLGQWCLPIRCLQFSKGHYDMRKKKENVDLQGVLGSETVQGKLPVVVGQHIDIITFSSCTQEELNLKPHLKKLVVFETNEDYKNGASKECFKRLSSLTELDILKCYFYKGYEEARNVDLGALPSNLKKLTLSGSCLSWEHMKFLAKLPNLETLKLKSNAFKGRFWFLTDEVFGRLKQLLIDNTDLKFWETRDREHFPCLERLVLRYCVSLKEIPSRCWNPRVLELIVLDHCFISEETPALFFKKEFENAQVVVRNARTENWTRLKDQIARLDRARLKGVWD